MKTPLFLILILVLFLGNVYGQNSQTTSKEDQKTAQNQVENRSTTGRLLDLYFEGVLAENLDLIPLANDVLFVEPDGRTFEGIAEVKPHITDAARRITGIRIIESVIEGDYGCKVTEYDWSNGATTPVAICFRVKNDEITEIRPYFDRPN